MTVSLRGAAPAAAAADYRPDFDEEVKEDTSAYASGAGGEEVGPRALSNSDHTSEFGRSFFQNGTIVPSLQESVVRTYCSLNSFGDLSSENEEAIRNTCLLLLRDLETDACALFPSVNANRESDPILRFKEIHSRVMKQAEKYLKNCSNLSLSALISGLKKLKEKRELKLLTFFKEHLEEKYVPFSDESLEGYLQRIENIIDFWYLHCLIDTGKGELDLVRTFLENSHITDKTRGRAVVEASEMGHLLVVRALLADGPISDMYRADAFKLATLGGHGAICRELSSEVSAKRIRNSILENFVLFHSYDELRILLKSGPFSDKAIAHAVGLAFSLGWLKKARALLEIAPNSDEVRGSAVCGASEHGDLTEVRNLLANGPISDEHRNRAVKNALRNRRHNVVALLDPSRRCRRNLLISVAAFGAITSAVAALFWTNQKV